MAIIDFRQEKSQEFSEGLIELLIDNEGPIRWAGNLILQSLMLGSHSSYHFPTDLLKYDKETQHRLAASILSNITLPEQIIPIALPLRKSHFPFIIDFIRFKLEELVEVYSSTIVKILESHLDISDQADLDLWNHINKKYEAFFQMFDQKQKILELNPYHTQARLQKKFQLAYQKHFREKMDKASNENSIIFQLVTKVVIGRGKGWKLAGSGSRSQLTHISSSFQLPRDYYISPDMYDFYRRMQITENWTDHTDKNE